MLSKGLQRLIHRHFVPTYLLPDITSQGKTSPTEPSGASFSFGGMMPIGNNNFFELSYDIKDIEYKNTLADGGDPEEDFTTLRAAFSKQF